MLDKCFRTTDDDYDHWMTHTRVVHNVKGYNVYEKLCDVDYPLDLGAMLMKEVLLMLKVPHYVQIYV